MRRVDVYGYSMGGGVALQLALDHPDLVRKWIFAGGTSFDPEGLHEGVLEQQEGMTPEALDGTPWKEAYLRLSPDPDFPTLVEKLKTLDLTWTGWTPEQIRSIQTPALLIIGDADVVRPEHTVQMFDLLGGASWATWRVYRSPGSRYFPVPHTSGSSSASTGSCPW